MSLGRRLAVSVVSVASVPLLLTGLGGCGVTAADHGAPAGTGGTEARAGAERGPVLAPKEVLAGLRGSLALVETPFGSGSGVLTDDGYVVTNAHVVDPFGVADLRFEGGDEHLDVEVVGVDLTSDIAVLGPIDTDRTPLAIHDGGDVAQGSELYLVGYPGDQEDPEVTITRGILSRRREAPGWGLGYLQSDAKIAPGQSGGALADERGRVLGISGLSDMDGYALSLDGADVTGSVEAILAGGGSDWEPAPTEADETTASFTVQDVADQRVLYIPAADEDRTVAVGVDAPDPLVALIDPLFFPLAGNQAALDDAYASPDEADLVEPAADGRWTFALEAGWPAMLLVGADVDEPTDVLVSSTVPFATVAGDEEQLALEPGGEPVEGGVGYLDDADLYVMELAAGDELDIEVSSASGDVAFTVVAPGATFDESEEFDDGGGGLFDLDATGLVTADVAGRYLLWVYQVQGAATDYRLTVAGP